MAGCIYKIGVASSYLKIKNYDMYRCFINKRKLMIVSFMKIGD